MLAMIGVGIWGSQLGKPAIWVLPVTFPLVMAIGGVLGVRGVPLPGVEVGVAASALALGVMILLAARPPLWVAAALVGVFAIFHGYAHGRNFRTLRPPWPSAWASCSPPASCTRPALPSGCVHNRPWGPRALRGIGAAIAAGGMYFVSAAL